MKENLEAERDKKLKRMTTEPVESLICKLAGPTIISMLVSSFYNMADTYFVGKIGAGYSAAEQAAVQTRAGAAVGVVFSQMAIIQAFGFFFGHGSGNYISRALGRRDTENAGKIASSGFFYAVIVGTLICVIGQIFAPQLALVLGATRECLDYTVDYMRIILIGAPIIMPSLVLNNQIRFQGNSMFAMVGITAGGVLNLALDPLFIFVFGLEVKGAAIATVISQFISLVLLFAGTERSDCIKIRFRSVRFDRFCIAEIFRGGIPSLCRQGLGSVATACLNNAAKVCGAAIVTASVSDPATSAVAGMTIVSKIMMFAGSALIGFCQGFQPVCGFNYGAGLYGRVKKAFRFCVSASFVFLICVAAVVIFFDSRVVGLFRDNDPLVLEIGSAALKYQCITFPLMSWVICSNMMLQTIGKAGRASLLAVSRQGLMFIPLILILPQFLGIFGVEIAQPCADVFSFILAIPVTLSVLRGFPKDSVPDSAKKAADDGNG